MNNSRIAAGSHMTVSIKHYDVIVLGAGAAGLMCALTAGVRGKRVLLLEASNKAGKKILMSGGGRCNFTNLYTSAENFLSANPHFVKSALSQFTQWDFIEMVETAGIDYHEKAHGQLFCDHSAKQIVQLLLDKCRHAGVELLLSVETVSVQARFLLTTNAGRFQAPSLVIATGGMSIPSLGGATGLGYQIARQFGLAVQPLCASLVPFTLTGRWHQFCNNLSGVALTVLASVPSKSFAESMLFTHRGLSGPAILQLSNYWSLGEEIEINLVPAVELADFFIKMKSQQPNSTLKSLLQQHLPRSLCEALSLELLGSAGQQELPLQQYTKQQLAAVAANINGWRLRPSGTEGYRTAEVTRGGVAVETLSSKTMEVNSVPGLYFIGEVVDVTGELGGFNFQWAWSSGHVAGNNI